MLLNWSDLFTGLVGGVGLAFLTRLFGGKVVVPVSRLTATKAAYDAALQTSKLALQASEREADEFETSAHKWETAYNQQREATEVYKSQLDELKQTAYIQAEIMRAVREATGGSNAQA